MENGSLRARTVLLLLRAPFSSPACLQYYPFVNTRFEKWHKNKISESLYHFCNILGVVKMSTV